MSGLALALLAAFGALAVVLRALVQFRWTGSAGLRGLGGSPGSAEWIGGVLLILALGLAPAGPAADLEGTLGPLGPLDGTIGHAAGAVLAVSGVLATVASQLAMGDAWRVGVDLDERTRLVTGGPFSVVRNPIYAGMILLLGGIALLVPNTVAIADFLLLVVAAELQTRLVEEPYLMRVHGRAYADYAAHVGRFLPGIGRIGR